MSFHALISVIETSTDLSPQSKQCWIKLKYNVFLIPKSRLPKYAQFRITPNERTQKSNFVPALQTVLYGLFWHSEQWSVAFFFGSASPELHFLCLGLRTNLITTHSGSQLVVLLTQWFLCVSSVCRFIACCDIYWLFIKTTSDLDCKLNYSDVTEMTWNVPEIMNHSWLKLVCFVVVTDVFFVRMAPLNSPVSKPYISKLWILAQITSQILTNRFWVSLFLLTWVIVSGRSAFWFRVARHCVYFQHKSCRHILAQSSKQRYVCSLLLTLFLFFHFILHQSADREQLWSKICKILFQLIKHVRDTWKIVHICRVYFCCSAFWFLCHMHVCKLTQTNVQKHNQQT